MTRVYEIYVGAEYRGAVTAKDEADARATAKGELWRHGEASQLLVQLIAERPKRAAGKTRRPNWRTKTGELRKRD